MSDLLSIGASGVRAYQNALSTVGDNIANTGVAGYTRRTASLREVAATGTGLSGGVQLSGNGVLAAGVVRQADAFRAAAVRDSGADLARTEAGATWLGRIESAMTENGLGDRITDFFTSARALAADPTSVPQRAVLLEKAGGAAAAFRQTGVTLSRATTELDATAQQAVATLNSLGAGLAKVNDGLARAQAGSAQAAQLMDQRDHIAERMSAISDVDVQYDTIGRATVKLGGASGPTFVAGIYNGQASFARNDEGAVQFAMQRDGETYAVTPAGGALAGVTEGAQRLANAAASLDAIAARFASAVNAVQAAGADLDGAAGAALFAPATSAGAMAVAMTDPRGLAAAAAGSPANSRGAANLDALEALRAAGGYETGVTTLTTDNAAALEQRKLIADAQGVIRDNAVAARESASGVDLDAEAVELLRFQQAYQASSRVIQTARDVLQTILDIR